ncbi:hypothetical protein TRFO_17891 [Tritrichomonas foetus]|uniref:Uncharacterized protein n=1 Tax=Tritrichomonas foetus TaxID=1144522 RepID=A0A1J4KLX2_9EUKA|nr:hypothetical protein TRFO_17891 [Tritrichomonas foetus]|eukprot:OHT12311.1 hypothetical protein TRFO_17891 [Tritrichomonas foetus]
MEAPADTNNRDYLLRVMTLPNEAQKNLERLAEKNQSLHNVLNSQDLIITDISETIPNVMNIEEKLANTDAELEKVNHQINNAHFVLYETLTKREKNGHFVGDFLKNILSKLQTLMVETCNDALSKGLTDVSIMSVIDIEQQVLKIIEDMHNGGMYPETDEEAGSRATIIEMHTKKILNFLKGFVGEADRTL